MTYFKEVRIGNFVLRFYPSDNGWMCGITQEMMRALENQQNPEREWVGLNFDALPDQWFGNSDFIAGARWAESKLKEKNNA